MAYIEERRTQKGISRVVRFRLGGQEVKIFLDSAYTRRDAEDAKSAVEGFLRAKKLDEPLDRKTRLYFESAPPDLLKRFVALGFSPARGASRVVDVWQTFQAAKSSTVKPSTQTHMFVVFARFRAYFPEAIRFDELTPEAIQEFRDELTKRYARTTVANTIAGLRTFGAWSVERGYAAKNPFLAVARGSTSNKERDFQVPADWAERIFAACPSQNWRTLFALWRFAGLRQQEPMYLTRDSVKLDVGRLIVFAPKTERYKNNGVREVPIAPILRRELVAHLKTMPQNEDFLIYENRRKAFDSGFRKIIFAAGLKKWPKTFQNLRSSCENDWIADNIPAHVVAEWLGHSVKTQETYYLRVLPEFFDRVTQKEPRFF